MRLVGYNDKACLFIAKGEAVNNLPSRLPLIVIKTVILKEYDVNVYIKSRQMRGGTAALDG